MVVTGSHGYVLPMTDHIDITDDRARAFADALQAFERDHDVSSFARLFAADALTQRFDARGERRGEVEQFWTEYQAQFDSVRTIFSNVVEADDVFALEWSSDATLAGGRSISYRGVTVVDFGGGDTVIALRTYYDSAQFSVGPASSS